MTSRFSHFVIFAEMRTGSNFLEANLNAFEGITCLGEAFNPHFIGYPNREDVLGITREERDLRPQRLVRTIRNASPGLHGFRYFHDHDARVLPIVMDDPECAKIILTRNPLDSYVSWKIAQTTGQWKLTNVKRRKDGKARFDADEFERHVQQLQTFQIDLMQRLQKSGQTAFYIAYEDLQDVEILNGMAKWLGVPEKLNSLNTALKRQNPEPLSEKVENLSDLTAGLARLDRFNLTRTPNFEPRRGAVVPSYIAGAETPLIYMPVRSGPEDAVTAWMAALDKVPQDALRRNFNRSTLRQWKVERPKHRSFTVLRHPVARAHSVFCASILPSESGGMDQIRRTLRRAHDLPIPEDWPDVHYDRDAHRIAFGAFLRFLKANLSGQTGVRVDANWASQSQCLQGLADYTLPDMIVREDEMGVYLPALAMQVGHLSAPDPKPVPLKAPYSLAEIYDDEIEALSQEAYARDYAMFGFTDWDEG